jgi:hypothetical protein
VAAWASRVARRLALAAAASATVLAWAFVDDAGGGLLGKLVVVALLYAPAAMLFAFSLAAGEVAELPAKLRSAPDTVAELARLARGRSVRGPRRAWRLLVLGRSARELLAPHAPLVALLSPWFLALTGAALVALWIEVAAAVAVLLSAAV